MKVPENTLPGFNHTFLAASNGRPQGLAGYTAVSTLSVDLENSEGKPGMKARFEGELWSAIAQAERQATQEQIVEALANSHLGYLVYEFLGKTLDSRPVLQERTQHSLTSDNDAFLASLVNQIQKQRGLKPTE